MVCGTRGGTVIRTPVEGAASIVSYSRQTNQAQRRIEENTSRRERTPATAATAVTAGAAGAAASDPLAPRTCHLSSPSVQVVEAISGWFWPVHGRTTLPPIRQHMEIFAVRMCRAYPDLFLTAVVKVCICHLIGQFSCCNCGERGSVGG